MNNPAYKDITAGTVMKTTNYSQFKRLEGNREALEARLQKIRKSVQENGQLFSPIIVNEKMQIIDGQGRYIVFAEMGLPIYYVMHKGYTLKECVILNAASSAWNLNDYISSYIAQGNENYQRLKELCDKHKEATVSMVVYAATGTSSGNRLVINGSLVISESTFAKADQLLSYAERFAPFFDNGYKARFLMGVMFAHEVPKIDPEKLYEKYIKYGHSTMFSTSVSKLSDAVALLEKIYNYRASANSTVYMTHIFDRLCRERAS